MRTLKSFPLITALLFTLTSSAQINQYDSRIDSYVGLRYPCDGSVQPVLRIQNVGGATMTSCDIDVLKNGITDNTFNWVLGVPAATNEFRQPVLPVMNNVQPGDDLEFRILTVNGQPDEGTDENILVVPMTDEKGDAGSYQVQVKVLTDDNPAETSWKIKNALGAAVAQSPGFTLAGELYETAVTLNADECYNFEVYDSGGDGFGEVRELGYARLVSVGQEVAAVGGDFGALYRKVAETGGADGCVPSKLTDSPDPIVSCGATGLLLNGTSTIAASEVPGANRYQFLFTNVPGQPAYLRHIAMATRSFTLYRWATLPLKRGRTYNVQVRASFNNGASWCDFGPSCTITLSHLPMAQLNRSSMDLEDEPWFSLFPNPSEDGHVNIVTSAWDEESPMSVEVFDMAGQQIRAGITTHTLTDGAMQLDLPTLPGGIYVVRVLIDGQAFNERLVVR